jgi:hypothetical protein
MSQRTPVTRDFASTEGHASWVSSCKKRRLDPKGVFYSQPGDNPRLILVFEKPTGGGWHYTAYKMKFKVVALPTKTLEEFF